VRRKLSACIAFTLLFNVSLIASTKDADVRQVSFDPKTGIVVFEITNFSNKSITAFNLSYDITYANGRVSHGERMVDYWPAMMAHIEEGDLSPGAGALHPGGTARETIGSRPSWDGSALQSINAVLDVVVYDDNTAVVTNKDVLGRVTAVRRARAKTIAKVDAIFQKQLASQKRDSTAALESDLNSLLSESKSNPGDLDSGEVVNTLDNLHRAKDKLDFLIRYAQIENKRVTPSAMSAKIEVQP